jgi:hypothetical protein
MTYYAKIEYSLIHLGQFDDGQHGICWNTTGSPTIEDEKIEMTGLDSTGKYSILMTELETDTHYYVRSFIRNDTTVVYSNTIHFETVSGETVMPEGSGTDEDPYQVSMFNNLLWLQHNPDQWDKHYIQILMHQKVLNGNIRRHTEAGNRSGIMIIHLQVFMMGSISKYIL